MDIEFRSRRLALIQTDRAGELRLPRSVITAWQERVPLIRAAPDVLTIRNWQSIGYEELDRGQHSIRLNDHWRVVFQIDENYTPLVMIVVEIDEFHEIYGRV